MSDKAIIELMQSNIDIAKKLKIEFVLTYSGEYDEWVAFDVNDNTPVPGKTPEECLKRFMTVLKSSL